MNNLWPTRLAAFPYAQPFLIGWQISDHSRDPGWSQYEAALDTYLASQDDTRSVGERYGALLRGRDLFQALLAAGDGHIGTHLALIRLHADLDDREAAINQIAQMLDTMPWLAEPLPDNLQITINRPFLSPTARYDSVPVEGTLADWLQAAVMEALDVLEGRA